MSANIIDHLPEALYIRGEREAEMQSLPEFDVLEYTGADEADAEWAYQEFQLERVLESEAV
jgi:hypothetical protein